MPASLSAAADILLGRLLRSPGPWRAAGLPVAEQPAMRELLARGLVEQHLGVYRPTATGRAAPDGPTR